jgi:TRAP-type C4-dicarboxylate transport system permease small subunit
MFRRCGLPVFLAAPPHLQGAGVFMTKAISYFVGCAAALVLALATLLFAQWPLREVFQAYSREANDLGQIIFAWYVAAGVAAASWRGVHLVVHASHRGNAEKTAHSAADSSTKWRALAAAWCVAPWAVFMLWSSFPTVVQSVANRERFAETLNPGYFAIRLALVVMLLLMLLWVGAQLRRAWASPLGTR